MQSLSLSEKCSCIWKSMNRNETQIFRNWKQYKFYISLSIDEVGWDKNIWLITVNRPESWILVTHNTWNLLKLSRSNGYTYRQKNKFFLGRMGVLWIFCIDFFMVFFSICRQNILNNNIESVIELVWERREVLPWVWNPLGKGCVCGKVTSNYNVYFL